jgi:hypothetical protein
VKSTTKIISILFINIILFSLVVVLVEGVFRIAGIPYKVKYIPDENSFTRFDPEMGWSYIPNKSSIHNTEYIIKPVYFEDNGIRVPYPDFEFDYSQPSILFIGGSFTMGHGLSYEESFVCKFSLSEGMPYQVVNLGVQGFGSDQALIALKKYLSKFNAKIIVYTFIEDHIFRNGNYDRRMLVPTARFLGTKPQFALNSDNELYLARKALLYENYFNSYLLDFLKMRIGKLLGTFPPFTVALTTTIIEEMKQYSNEHNAHFVVINWKWSHDDYDELFHDLKDIDVIDTMKKAPEGWDKMGLHGGIHPNEEAGEYVVSLLLDYFREKDLL